MKIAILNRYQHTIARGAESFVQELSRQLQKRHRVEILSGQSSDNLSKIISGNFQIVLSINGGWQSFKASLGRLKGGYKLVIAGQAGIGRGEIFNLSVCKPDLYIALTEAMRVWAKKWAWGSKVIKIPNGVDLNKFKPTGEKINLDLPRPIILSVGALVWYKHHERIIQALSLLKEGSLLIVGDGPQRQMLEEIGKKLLGYRLKIVKFAYNDMPQVYRSADLFTLPSWDREAFGIVYLEAMAEGLGIVAPDDLARREIIGEAGILVNVGDSKKYAEAIEKALEFDWKNKALRQAKKFSWEIVGEKYEQAFLDLLK